MQIVDKQCSGVTIWSAPEDPSGSTGVCERAPALLPRPSPHALGSGDPIDELVMLLAQANHADKRAARALQCSEDAAQLAEESAKIAEMHAKADDTQLGGWAQGLAEVGAGIGQVGAAGFADVAGKVDLHDASNALASSSRAAGAVVLQEYKAAGERHDARATEHGTRADWAKRHGQRAHDQELEANESLKKVAAFLKEIRAAENGAMSAVASYRA